MLFRIKCFSSNSHKYLLLNIDHYYLRHHSKSLRALKTLLSIYHIRKFMEWQFKVICLCHFVVVKLFEGSNTLNVQCEFLLENMVESPSYVILSHASKCKVWVVSWYAHNFVIPDCYESVESLLCMDFHFELRLSQYYQSKTSNDWNSDQNTLSCLH